MLFYLFLVATKMKRNTLSHRTDMDDDEHILNICCALKFFGVVSDHSTSRLAARMLIVSLPFLRVYHHQSPAHDCQFQLFTTSARVSHQS